MIRSLHLKNFKCFESQKLEFAPLTLLTGLNAFNVSLTLEGEAPDAQDLARVNELLYK